MKHLPVACLSAIALFASLLPMRAEVQDAAPAPSDVAPQTQKPPSGQPPPAPAVVHVVDATAANSGEALVSMSFDETPLSDVIKAFRDATGANIISSGTNLQGTVSVRLDNVPWRKGLGSILDPQGLQLIEQPISSGIFVVTAKTVDVPLVTQTFSLDNAKADDVAKLFSSTLGKAYTATPFPSANVVIVTATEQQLAECEKIIKAIDKPRTQVYIEARFVELSSAASKKLGMKWDSLGGNGWGFGFDGAGVSYSDTKSSAQTRSVGTSRSADETTTDSFANALRTIESDLITQNGSSDSFSNKKTRDKSRIFSGSLSADALKVAINAFEQMDGASVFSNPKVIVANEESASVDMTTKEPNVEVQATRSGTSSDQLDITTKLTVIPGKDEPFVGEAFFSYGISLKVTPRVSSSGLITVQIEPSISELQDYFTISTSLDTPTAKYPIIKVSRMKTVFTMQSGSTAVIGGLTRTEEGNTDSGIPYLRELPWVGSRLFGWKSRAKEQKEIVIFVSVGIADPTDLKEDIGMPKNALLSRDILNGKLKEPGDRTKEELMSVKDPERPVTHPKPALIEAPAAERAPQPEAVKPEAPVKEEPAAEQAPQPEAVKPAAPVKEEAAAESVPQPEAEKPAAPVKEEAAPASATPAEAVKMEPLLIEEAAPAISTK